MDRQNQKAQQLFNLIFGGGNPSLFFFLKTFINIVLLCNTMKKIPLFLFAFILIGFASATTIITDCQGLQNMNLDLHGDYLQAYDLDCSNFGNFIPIGELNNPFEGTFTTYGGKIHGLNIYQPNERFVGLFGLIGNAGVVEAVILEHSRVEGDDYVGSIAGYNGGIIKQSKADGKIYGDGFVGGVVGMNDGTLSEIIYKGELTANTFAGGLIGQHNSGMLENSYVHGSLNINQVGGGAVGIVNNGIIQKVYSVSEITRNSGNGGFVGVNINGLYNGNFWDKGVAGQGPDTGNQGNMIGIKGLGSQLLQTGTPYLSEGWNQNIWTKTNSYPFLKWE